MEEFRKKGLGEIFAQECEVSDEISIWLDELSAYIIFNEKNNEMYYEDHDHSNAKFIIIDHSKSITIDSVNDDCLSEIFMYVPACERPKIALVCQKWKRVLGLSWGNVKKLELTHWEYDEYPSCLKKYPTLDGQFSFLKSLLSKCGRYLTQLDLTAYGHCNIVPVINEYCPNLVKLRLRFTYVDNIILFDAFSGLSKLKVLAIIFQDFKDKFIPITLIYSLLRVANTLTDLILSNWKDKLSCNFSKDTVRVLRELKALRRLEMGGITISQEFTDYRTNKISLFTNYNNFWDTNTLKKLRNIEVLNLARYLITDDGLYTIANVLKKVKTLNFYSDYITNDGVVAISKMNLLVLGFSGINNVINSSSMKLLKNLRRLKLPACNNVTDDVAITVLENSPEMDMLHISYTNITVKFIKKAHEISRNRKIHLSLTVSLKAKKKNYESQYLDIDIEENNEYSLSIYCINRKNL